VRYIAYSGYEEEHCSIYFFFQSPYYSYISQKVRKNSLFFILQLATFTVDKSKNPYFRMCYITKSSQTAF